ncbi:MAG: hypothetical protein PHG04_04110 [Candidatus Nanoarchaeia archaeon]|nr:hypothetical protein [Candidatus Nanoarchaeia archaeon]
MNPEAYFLRYARPCADFMHQRKEITGKDLKKLDLMLEEKIKPDKAFIERIFYKAINPLKKLSDDYWNINVIRKYFQKEHNSLIDNKAEGFEHLTGIQKELCRVWEGVIIGVAKDYYEVNYNGNNSKILKGFVKDAKIGDAVFIHYAMAIEKK